MKPIKLAVFESYFAVDCPVAVKFTRAFLYLWQIRNSVRAIISLLPGHIRLLGYYRGFPNWIYLCTYKYKCICLHKLTWGHHHPTIQALDSKFLRDLRRFRWRFPAKRPTTSVRPCQPQLHQGHFARKGWRRLNRATWDPQYLKMGTNIHSMQNQNRIRNRKPYDLKAIIQDSRAWCGQSNVANKEGRAKLIALSLLDINDYQKQIVCSGFSLFGFTLAHPYWLEL